MLLENKINEDIFACLFYLTFFKKNMIVNLYLIYIPSCVFIFYYKMTAIKILSQCNFELF